MQKLKLKQILTSYKLKKINLEEAEQQILELFQVNDVVPLIEVPILVGHLNKAFGYNNCKPIEVGTPVYSFKDRYQFEVIPLNGTVSLVSKFYKDDLKKCINFIDDENFNK